MIPYYDKNGITIYCGDCLEVMPQLNQTFDAIISDWPYGITGCSWDSVIPLDRMWVECKKAIKNKGIIVLTSSQPFTTDLINSNRKWFRYEWIWEKSIGANPLLCKKIPMKYHENILIFYKKFSVYNPQMTIGRKRDKKIQMSGKTRHDVHGNAISSKLGNENYLQPNINNLYYPTSIIYFSNANQKKKMHPTQKPLALMRYLIRTYTNKNEIILDNTMGSGTTLVAAKTENRRAIGIELSEEYCEVAVERLKEVVNVPLF